MNMSESQAGPSRRTHRPWSQGASRFTLCGRRLTDRTLIATDAEQPTCKVCRRVLSSDARGVKSAMVGALPGGL